MRRDLLCRKSEIYRFSSSCRTDANHYRNATADHFTRQVHHLDAFLEGQGVLLTRGSADHNAVDPGAYKEVNDSGIRLGVDAAIAVKRRDERREYPFHLPASAFRGEGSEQGPDQIEDLVLIVNQQECAPLVKCGARVRDTDAGPGRRRG